MNTFYRFICNNKISMFLFLMVGTVSALVNFISFSLLWNVFEINYQIAASIAYILSVIVHFTANRNLTFKSYGKNTLQQIRRYVVILMVNYLVMLMTVHTVVENLKFSPYLGIAFAIGLTVSTGYLASQFWIFRVITE